MPRLILGAQLRRQPSGRWVITRLPMQRGIGGAVACGASHAVIADDELAGQRHDRLSVVGSAAGIIR
jgi:hypothetical protein